MFGSGRNLVPVVFQRNNKMGVCGERILSLNITVGKNSVDLRGRRDVERLKEGVN